MEVALGRALMEGPIILVADEDWDSMNRLTGMLSPDYFLLYARNGFQTIRIGRKFKPSVFVLSDSLEYRKLGTAKLIDDILSEFDAAAVIVLVEDGKDAERENWKKLGAVDCLPHPTKWMERTTWLDNRIREFARPFGK